MNVLAALLTLSLAVGATEQPVRRALVVAYNGSPGPGRSVLRFADDDGLLWAEVLQRLGVQTKLLTVADEDTARLGSPLLAQASAPTMAALTAAVDALRVANEADRAAGRQVDALFVFVGHGERDPAGRSTLLLLDGQLDRAGLYEQVIDRLGGGFVHVVIDACRAAGVVGSRAGDPQVLEQLHNLLEREQLAARPTVGAIYAESEDGETHEWSEIRAGLLSHAVRSGLLGAADVNGDGLVEYSELDAFVAASLSGVQSAKARLRVHTFAPVLDAHRALVGPAPRGSELVLGGEVKVERLSIEDELGVRLADVHRVSGEPLRLALPSRPRYWLRGPDGERQVAAASLSSALPPPAPLSVAGRGPTEESLRAGLFSIPFGRLFYQGYVASTGVVGVTFAPAKLRGQGDAGPVGLEVAALAATAPLGARGILGGLQLSWRTSGPLFVGARLGYGIAPAAEQWGQSLTFHRAAAQVLLGWVGPGALTATAELGAGWLLIAIPMRSTSQGDPLGVTADATVGARWRPTNVLHLSLVAGAQLDLVRVGGRPRVDWAPVLRLGLGF